MVETVAVPVTGLVIDALFGQPTCAEAGAVIRAVVDEVPRRGAPVECQHGRHVPHGQGDAGQQGCRGAVNGCHGAPRWVEGGDVVGARPDRSWLHDDLAGCVTRLEPDLCVAQLRKWEALVDHAFVASRPVVVAHLSERAPELRKRGQATWRERWGKQVKN